MKNELITNIEQEMMSVLDNAQMEHLKKVLEHCFFNVSVYIDEQEDEKEDGNAKLLDGFMSSKKIEGCSAQTLKYYKSTIENMLETTKKTRATHSDGGSKAILRCLPEEKQCQQGYIGQREANSIIVFRLAGGRRLHTEESSQENPQNSRRQDRERNLHGRGTRNNAR